jgi:phage terminase small subunit
MPILKNPRHEKYAQLLAQMNSQDAAYAGAGYKPNASHASRLARNGKVAARVAELVEIGAEKAEIDVAKVLAELAKIGFANMLDYVGFTKDGDPYVTLANMTRDQAAAVQQITVEDYKDGRGEDARDVRKVTFKLADKRAALVDIGTHLKMFTQKLELAGKDGKDLVPIINLHAARRDAG